MVVVCTPLYYRGTLNGFYGNGSKALVGGGNPWAWGTASDDNLSLGMDAQTSAATLFNAWLANVPQLLFSFAYLNINTICTSMAGAEEWNSLATARKHLRVTNPVGEQRSTYFLQLPYRWSLPLVAIGGFLHWTLSQAFFLVRIDYFNRDGARNGGQFACGFSALSLITFVAISMALLLVIGVVGFRKMLMHMPIAGSCSLAISAACHPPPEETDPQLKRIKWGVTKAKEGEDHPHCSLSSGPVTDPKYGEIYS
jgi:hypothetical protein